MYASQSRPKLPLPSFEKPLKLLLVVAHDPDALGAVMVEAAQALLAQVGAGVEVIEMPSVLELASAIALAERMARFDGYIALGCVLRDDPQGESLLREPAAAITLLGLQGAAVGNGVVWVQDSAQAAGFVAAKAAQAAAAALHLIALSRKWASDTKGIGFRP